MRNKLMALALIAVLACGLTGCDPTKPKEGEGCDGHLHQFLEDMKKDPTMKPMYDEEAGHWVAVPDEP